MIYYNHKREQRVPPKRRKAMKKYAVTIYTRSNACINPNKVIFQHIVEAKTAKQAKLYTWYYFNAWYNSAEYSRHDLRIEVKQCPAE